MVKTRSASGGGGDASASMVTSSNNRRLLKTRKASSSTSASPSPPSSPVSATSTKTTTVSRGSQTTCSDMVAISELRRDLIGVSAAANSSASAMQDLSQFKFPPELSVELCPPSTHQLEDPQPGTSTGIVGRKRRAASSSGDNAAVGLSSATCSQYASNVVVAPGSSVMNKKFLSLGEPVKKRRRSSDESEEVARASIRATTRKKMRRELDAVVDRDEEDVHNVTDDEEFWSDVDGDVMGSTNHECHDDEEDDEEVEGDFDGDNPPGDRVAYIHVGEGGEADLEAQLKGAENLDIQILEEEDLPDIDETDMIHGLDHTGTARDYVDERHRCSAACPVGCQGHLRPNEIVIYESFKWKGKLRGRRR